MRSGKIKELEKEINSHRIAYEKGNSKISDEEYDELEEKLRKIDPHNKIFNRVGTSPASSSGKKIKHDQKMLSLNKTYELEELKTWIGNYKVVSTFKIDGVSASLIYKKGKFSLAKTRGDGTWGEEITQAVQYLSSIPKTIPYKNLEFVEVRGEVYCDEKNFLKLSKEMESKGLNKPNNPRNITAGLLGRVDHFDLCRYLNFKAFHLITSEEIFKTEYEKMNILKKMEFNLPIYEYHKEFKTIKKSIQEMQDFMAKGNYQIDGIVFSYDDTKLHKKLGSTAHHPRYKMAFKLQGEVKETFIEEIQWMISRNGILTPIALVKPITLSGAQISRLTLHNFGMVKQYNLKKGDKIKMVRSGEVIPKFIAVTQSQRGLFSYPKKCSICSSPTRRKDIRLYCSNKKCPGKLKESILNFIKKIGIENISGKRLDEMIKENLIKDIPDLYRLTSQKLMSLDKVKIKLSNKLIESIEQSKQADLTQFLSSLGIQGGAYHKCEKVVMAGFNTIEKILDLKVDQLVQIESFAEKSAHEFISSLDEKKTLIKKLKRLNFKLEAPKIMPSQNKSSPLQGKTICLTGSLSIKRSEMEMKLRQTGAHISSQVSSQVDYLLTNDTQSHSSKFKKAKKLKIKIISEKEINKIIK